MIRFKNAPELQFTANPQGPQALPARVYHEGAYVGTVAPHHSDSRGLCFRVYNRDGLCVADCGQIGNTFSVLRGILATQGEPQCRL